MKYSVRCIAFRPEWVEEFGDINTVIYFQQIFYWSDKGKLPDGWVFKTIEEIEYETTLTKDQQKRCREKLVAEGFIEVEKRKALFGNSMGAPVLHFRILRFPANALSGNSLMDYRETRQSSITESTTKNNNKGNNFFFKEKPKTPRGWTNQRREEIGKPPLRTPRSEKQDIALKALKMKDYFRDKGYEQHGMQFFLVKSKERESKMTKLVHLAYQTLGEETKDLIDWWLSGAGEWAEYEPEQCFSTRTIEKYLNSKNKKEEEGGILGYEPVERKTRAEELDDFFKKLDERK